MELFVTAGGAFLLVFLAEFGDKSQLVCMALAARYRAKPVIFGAVLAFAVLNLLAVTLGALAAEWLPRWLVLLIVAFLFLWFGIQSLLNDDDEDDGFQNGAARSAFVTAFSVIFLAELGDKTQLAVAGLAASEAWIAVWIGATMALAMTTVLGVMAGRVISQYISVQWMHRLGGTIFLLFATVALYKLWLLLTL